MSERHLSSPLLGAFGVRHGFSLRTGGTSSPPYASLNLGKAVGDDPSRVDENLALFCEAVGVERTSLATVSQVHGTTVVVARAAGLFDLEGRPLSGNIEADAIIALEGQAAGVRVADCVPVLLLDPVTGLAAAVHAGWRGTVGHIVSRTVEALQSRFGVNPADLRAAIGPCIGLCCFEVGDEVAAQFESAPFGDVVDRRGPTPHVDLTAANVALLRAAGIPTRQIDLLGRCTACNEALFFSHRRDRGVTGRPLAVFAGGGRPS